MRAYIHVDTSDLLHELLYLSMRGGRMRVLKLRGLRRALRGLRHRLSSLGIVEWRVRHVSIVVLRWWRLRHVVLGWREIGAGSADVSGS